MDKGLSFYNEGYFQIQRLNSLWVQANLRSISGDRKGWRFILDCIWRELSRDLLKDVDFVTEKTVWYEDNEYYKSYKQFKKGLDENVGNDSVYYALLVEYDVFLRYLQDKVGKGGKYTDPDSDSMD